MMKGCYYVQVQNGRAGLCNPAWGSKDPRGGPWNMEEQARSVFSPATNKPPQSPMHTNSLLTTFELNRSSYDTPSRQTKLVNSRKIEKLKQNWELQAKLENLSKPQVRWRAQWSTP